MFVFLNVIRPQGLEPLQVSTKNGTPSINGYGWGTKFAGLLHPQLSKTTRIDLEQTLDELVFLEFEISEELADEICQFLSVKG